MSSCEKCWRDAGGDPDQYHYLLEIRKGERACTLEEQAGDGLLCKSCGRKTIHMYTDKCINRDCKLFGDEQIRS